MIENKTTTKSLVLLIFPMKHLHYATMIEKGGDVDTILFH